MKKVYLCTDNVTGLYSALYDAWKECREAKEAGIAVKGNMEPQLFCDYVEVEETGEKAIAVERLIKKHLGMEAYSDLYYVALSADPQKGDTILGTMLEARRLADSRQIMKHLTCDVVLKAFEISRRVGNEAHYFLEFLRFKELKSGILIATIKPKNQVLTCIAPHFADRLPLENWMIYDESHEMFVVHERQKQWVLISGMEADKRRLHQYSENELNMEKLWKGFCKSISIDERYSYDRQRQHLPLWLRPNMVEFEQ